MSSEETDSSLSIPARTRTGSLAPEPHELTDRVLKCVDCEQEFVFGTGEQFFFRQKGFQHEPRHCKKCKAKFTNKRGRVETSVTRSECSAPTTVPFVPHLGRPVLCRSCFQRRRV
jgi:CxxC-x17-CxxC domain-containing protein